MSFTENYKAHQEAEKAKTAPVVPQEPSLASVMADNEQSATFVKMLEAEGVPDILLERMAKSESTSGDLDFLQSRVKMFNERKRQSVEALKVVDAASLKLLCASHPDLQRIVDLAGDQALSIIQERLAELAITKPANFKPIADQIVLLNGAKTHLKMMDKDIADIRKKHGITDEKALEDAMMIKDDAKRVEAVQKLFYEKSKNLKKHFWDDKNYAAWEEAEKIAGVAPGSTKVELDTRIAAIDGEMRTVGTILGMALHHDKEINAAIARAIGPKRPEIKTREAGFNEMGDLMADEETMQSEFAQFKATFKEGKRQWKDLNPAEKEAKKEGFFDGFMDKNKKKLAAEKGKWAKVFGGMFNLFDTPARRSSLDLD